MKGWKNFQICSEKMNFALGNYKQYGLVSGKQMLLQLQDERLQKLSDKSKKEEFCTW